MMVRFCLPYCLFAFILSAAAGCSDSPVVPVSGSVSFANQAAPEVCRLTFVPKETKDGIRPGSATMSADGTYRVSPYKGVEGLLPGVYAVRLSYFDLKKNGDRGRDADWIEKTFEGEELVVEAGSRGVTHDIEVQ